MKKRIVTICASIFILLVVVRRMALRLFMIVGCVIILLFNHESNKRPDDDISKAIREAVGRNKVYYHGKKTANLREKKVYLYGKEYVISGEITMYSYVIHDFEDETLLTDIVEAANAAIKERTLTQKVDLEIREEFVSGAYRAVVWLSNYYENEDGYEQYEFLQELHICGTKRSNKGELHPYNMASTYITLPDIKSLVVTEKIAQSAEEEGIDWYEIWPDLEHYEVLED